MKINKKLDYNTELMLITMEECGELIEACSKAIRCEEYYDKPKFIEELGDVQCMIELILDNELVRWEDVRERIKVKKEKLKKYTNLLNDQTYNKTTSTRDISARWLEDVDMLYVIESNEQKTGGYNQR